MHGKSAVGIGATANRGAATRASVSGCLECQWRTLCLPGELTGEELSGVAQIGGDRRRVAAGDSFYRAGDRFSAIYAIRSGFVKETMRGKTGKEQIVGFRMAGEVIGIDGFARGQHCVTASALEDTEVCVVPFALLERLSREVPALSRRFHALLAAEIARANSHMLLLGKAPAEESVAAFLLELSSRYARRGYSRSALRLRMTRGEIGSYLGLKFETVTRAFHRFRADGLIAVAERQISILDRQGLEALCAQRSTEGEAQSA